VINLPVNMTHRGRGVQAENPTFSHPV